MSSIDRELKALPKPDLNPKTLIFHAGSICFLMLLAAFSRLLPHPPNMTPIGAMALYGGAVLAPRFLAFLLPLGAMALSDYALYLLNGYPPNPSTYFCFCLEIGMGLLIRHQWNRGASGILWVGGAGLISSLNFYLITNFFCWYQSSYYSQDVEGLMLCYTQALPFYQYTLIGDAFFIVVFFVGWRRIELFMLEKIQKQAAESAKL